MKKIFLLTSVVFNLSASITIAQTNVPGGLVSGTWTLAGSPYLIQGSVQIPNDSTLTIKPGVTIIFQGTYKLNVQGRLLAIGTNVDTIVFTAANISNGWRGIRFNGTSAINDSSKVIYCKLQYGKANGPSPDDNGGALYFNNFSKTIISNCLISNCTANTSGGGIYCSVSNPMIINNFITKNSISNNTNYWHSGGGGIFCTGSSPNISNNTITYNVAPFGCGCGDEGGGGGICCMDSNPIINNNTISNNTASGGGGIYSTGSPTITNNTISYNISSNDGGGGICCDEFGGSPIISNNFISNNTAFSTGGGILTDVFSSITNNTLINNSALNGGAISFYRAFSSILSNNVISNNSATSVGGALYCSEGCFPTITNNTITNNMASNGGALYCDQGSNPTFRNCILYGNNASKSGMQVSLFDDASDPGFYYCDVQGGSAAFELNGNFYGGTYQNNINADPLFVEPSSGSGSNYNGEIADWSLQNGSPCINAGDSTITNYPATDLAGNPRLTFSRIEIGAYEYQAGLSFNVSLNILQSILCNDDTTGEVAAIASGGSLPYTYLWSNGQTTANAIGLAAGIYRVRVTEASYGWTITKSITLTQPPALLVNAGLDKYIICRGTVELDSITSNYNGSGLLSYLWSPATGLNYDTIPNPIATVTNNTKYFVTVSTPNGCIAKDSVKVTVNPLTVNGEADKTIICGGKVQFDNPITNYTGSGTLSYSWLPKEGLDSAKLAQPTAEIISDKTYTLSVSTPNGCIAKDSVKVTVNPLTVNGEIDKSIICGGKVQFDNPITNYTGSGTLSYSWLPKEGLDSAKLAQPTAEIISDKTFTLSVSTPNGCIAKDSVKVTVNPLTVSGEIDKSIICGDKVQFDNPITNYTGSGTLSYSWLPKEGLDSAKLAQPTAEIISYKIYTLSVSTPNGCIAKDSVKVTVNPLTVNGETDKSIICGGNVQFDNPITNYTGLGTLSYSWLPETGLDSAKLARPTAEMISDKTYTLSVSTPNGCIAKDSVKVTVIPLTVNGEIDKSIICGGNVQFDNPITNYTGSGTLSYSWLPKEGLDSAKLAQPTAEIISDKTYTLSVSTPNGCITKDSVKVTVIPLIAIANDITVSCGNTAQLDVTTNYTGSGSLIYNWVPASGLSSTIIANPIATLKTKASYSVDVKTPNGCYATDNINVSTSVISFNPSICMVTVNDNDKNVVVWQREQNTAIDTFYIYRESSIQTGQYDIIGNLPYSATGVFVDTGSNARIQSNKYKIAIKDVCGFITDKSSEHKTMHLTINKGVGNTWNLIWEQYIGVPVSSYRIYRGTTKANLAQIGSSSGSNTTYTDETAPAGDVYYQIEVVLPQACTNLKSTGYASSLSNIISSADVVTGISVNSVTQTFIYPNPAFDMLNIKNVHSLNATIMIFDLQGKQILNKQIVSGQIDISNFSKGIYIIKLIDSGNVLINKFVKE